MRKNPALLQYNKLIAQGFTPVQINGTLKTDGILKFHTEIVDGVQTDVLTQQQIDLKITHKMIGAYRIIKPGVPIFLLKQLKEKQELDDIKVFVSKVDSFLQEEKLKNPKFNIQIDTGERGYNFDDLKEAIAKDIVAAKKLEAIKCQ